MSAIAEPLTAFMTRIAGPGALSGLSRLSGGANMESWAFDWTGADGSCAYVLRRAPSADICRKARYSVPPSFIDT